jgi:hypothetical protein
MKTANKTILEQILQLLSAKQVAILLCYTQVHILAG